MTIPQIGKTMHELNKEQDRNNFIRFLMLYLLSREKFNEKDGLKDTDIKSSLNSLFEKNKDYDWNKSIISVVNQKSLMVMAGHLGIDRNNYYCITTAGENTMHRLKNMYANCDVELITTKIIELSDYCDSVSQHYVFNQEDKSNVVANSKKIGNGKMG